MANLIYSAIVSLDGYVEDAQGTFDWAAPDDEVLAAVNDLQRPIGTYLYGRRMYETMVYWSIRSTAAASLRRPAHTDQVSSMTGRPWIAPSSRSSSAGSSSTERR